MLIVVLALIGVASADTYVGRVSNIDNELHVLIFSDSAFSALGNLVVANLGCATETISIAGSCSSSTLTYGYKAYDCVSTCEVDTIVIGSGDALTVTGDAIAASVLAPLPEDTYNSVHVAQGEGCAKSSFSFVAAKDLSTQELQAVGLNPGQTIDCRTDPDGGTDWVSVGIFIGVIVALLAGGVVWASVRRRG